MSITPSPAPEVSTQETAEAIANGASIIDVREPAEYAAGHIPEARLFPLGEVLDRVGELNASDRLYVVCAVGGRSMAAAGALRELGIDAVSVAGGTNAWIAEEREVATN